MLCLTSPRVVDLSVFKEKSPPFLYVLLCRIAIFCVPVTMGLHQVSVIFS